MSAYRTSTKKASDKQVAFAQKLMDELDMSVEEQHFHDVTHMTMTEISPLIDTLMERSKEAREAKWAVKREQEILVKTLTGVEPWEAGRQVVTGTIEGKLQYNNFGQLKGRLACEDGKSLWISVPGFDPYEDDEADVVGTTYTIKVTVTPADNDPFFGFGKIPKVV